MGEREVGELKPRSLMVKCVKGKEMAPLRSTLKIHPDQPHIGEGMLLLTVTEEFLDHKGRFTRVEPDLIKQKELTPAEVEKFRNALIKFGYEKRIEEAGLG